METTHGEGGGCHFPVMPSLEKSTASLQPLPPSPRPQCPGVGMVRALGLRGRPSVSGSLLAAPGYVRRRSRPLGIPFSRKHLKNAGRQRSSRFGYLLPLVLPRNSLADYTALTSTTPALCPELWEGSSPAPPPPPRRGICRENTSGEKYFHQIL